MKLWASTRDEENRVIRETVQEFNDIKRKSAGDADYEAMIGKLCEAMDLARPVFLKKHLRDIAQFSHVHFKPMDFMEPVDFIRMEVVIFPDAKK